MAKKLKIGIATNTLTETQIMIRNLADNDFFKIQGIFISEIKKIAPNTLKSYKIYNNIGDFIKEDYDIVLSTVNYVDYERELAKYNCVCLNDIDTFFNGLNVLMQESASEQLDITTKKLKTLLNTLDFVRAVIEVSDAKGNITYVNPEFTRITGIPYTQRINKNVFKVSPDGGLAKCLRLKEDIRNHRTKIGGTNIEVVSYASPIIANGKIQGAVVICNEMNDIYKLMDELQKSKEVIKNISTKIEAFSTSKYTFDDIIGQSNRIKDTICMAKKYAQADTPVLIFGETGTGKELMAHSIHAESPRRSMPFVVVNCAAIPDNLLESELFGHEKGSFTGAVNKRIGKFELADKGTIFLDEIGELNLNLQTKLLRVLQDQVIEPIGSTGAKKIDVRIVSATNRDLKKMIKEGRFREDLYYRLHVLEIIIPPLRERKEDIPLLVDFFIKKFNRRQGKSIKGFADDTLELLKDHNWPGNIRELENLIEKFIITNDGYVIDKKYILENMKNSNAYNKSDIDSDEIYPLDLMEKKMITKALSKYGDNVLGKQFVAQKLNISLSTLYNKIQKYNIKF